MKACVSIWLDKSYPRGMTSLAVTSASQFKDDKQRNNPAFVVMATFFKKWFVSCHGCNCSCRRGKQESSTYYSVITWKPLMFQYTDAPYTQCVAIFTWATSEERNVHLRSQCGEEGSGLKYHPLQLHDKDRGHDTAEFSAWREFHYIFLPI